MAAPGSEPAPSGPPYLVPALADALGARLEGVGAEVRLARLASPAAARAGVAEPYVVVAGTEADAEALRGVLERFGLPVEPPRGLDPAALVAHMRLDKKAVAGGLRFVLWDGTGRARVAADVPEAEVLAVLRGA